jgi:hypothetical protein
MERPQCTYEAGETWKKAFNMIRAQRVPWAAVLETKGWYSG